MSNVIQNQEIYHYGIKRRSGRYPWGSGERPYQSAGGRKNIATGLQNYTSPFKEHVVSNLKMIPHYALSMVIPGYGVAYNLNTVRRGINDKFDHTNYYKREGAPEKVSDMKKKSQASTIIEDMNSVNPRLGKQKGKINNCINCTMALEMRRRGYDVIARSSGQGDTVYAIDNWFEGVNKETVKSSRQKGESRKDYINRSYDELTEKIAQEGDGSRGYICLVYDKMLNSGGHCLYWEVRNGQTTFYDGQNKTTGYKTDRVFALSDPSAGYVFARLDNLPTTDAIGERVVSRKDKKDAKSK